MEIPFKIFATLEESLADAFAAIQMSCETGE
jgi:hypothetical protein